MPAYNLIDLGSVVRSWGRGVVFRAPRWSPGDGPLTMEHLGDTEGNINIVTNPAMANLTTPELTGPAPIEVDYEGEAPVIEIPMYLTDPAKLALVSPSGTNSAGRSRRSAPAEHTLAIFPEGLFLEAGVDGIVDDLTLDLTAGVWTLDSQVLSLAQEARLGQAFWAWRVVFNRPPMHFNGGAGDARKNIETVSAMVCHHPDMPEGHHLYTIGNPLDADINIETGS